jgi:hypothetical protein
VSTSEAIRGRIVSLDYWTQLALTRASLAVPPREHHSHAISTCMPTFNVNQIPMGTGETHPKSARTRGYRVFDGLIRSHEALGHFHKRRGWGGPPPNQYQSTVSNATAAAALTPLRTYEDTAMHSNSRYISTSPVIEREQAVHIQLQGGTIPENQIAK